MVSVVDAKVALAEHLRDWVKIKTGRRIVWNTASVGAAAILALLETVRPPPKPEPGYSFAVGQLVQKHTGDYQIAGEVRSAFATMAGKVRYVVEHKAEGGGSFCHIYSADNLRPLPTPPKTGVR